MYPKRHLNHAMLLSFQLLYQTILKDALKQLISFFIYLLSSYSEYSMIRISTLHSRELIETFFKMQ